MPHGIVSQSQDYDIMPPSKRTKYSSSSRALTKGKIQGKAKNWPYANPKSYIQVFDPFPAKMRCIMRYSTVVELDPATGLNAINMFRANSIFDPDQSGIGHQPYGHDTYLSIYNHYNVHKSTITMQPQQGTGNFGITLTDDTSVQGDYDTVREVKGTKWACMGSNSESATKVVQHYNQKSFQNRTETQAAFGTNPSEQTFFHCWFQAKDKTSDSGSVSFVISISYIVDMWELRDLGQS